MKYWSDQMMTAVSALHYDFDSHSAMLTLPAGCCGDMGGIIAFCQRIDPGVVMISCFQDIRPDVVYRKAAGSWRAILLADASGHRGDTSTVSPPSHLRRTLPTGEPRSRVWSPIVRVVRAAEASDQQEDQA